VLGLLPSLFQDEEQLLKAEKQATCSQRIQFYVNRDALQRSRVRVLKIFIQNWALLAHIHLNLLGASFTSDY